jgi:phosphatidylserine/phosphatidylglycerophosphate/cardiolipin synthase-like enzyme
MKLSDFALKNIVPFLIGNRKGSELVDLFNKFGFRDIYDENGLPDIKKVNRQRPSKKEYVFARLKELSGKHEFRKLIELIANESPEYTDQINELITPEHFKLETQENRLIVMGGVIDRRKPVLNEAHFQDIQNKILNQLDKARVSIRVVMAWFTNDTLFQKIIEKHNQGVDVKIAIYDDGINKKYGVDVTQLPHIMIKRGKAGGIMHDKFCVIDNQIVITGSYNWTNNAEFRNDENITVENDPEQATRFSEEFRRLTT